MQTHADLFEFEDEPIETGFTTVQNLFLTHFMPHANGNYVKVYLAGLMRCYGNKSDQWASMQTIADEQRVSRDTVRRAWRHWESVGIIRRIPRFIRDRKNPHDYKTERCEEYHEQTSNIIRFRRDLRPLIEQSFGGCTTAPGAGAHMHPGGVHACTPKKDSVEEPQREEGQDKTKGSGLVVDSPTDFSSNSDVDGERLDAHFELYVERPPTKRERRTLRELAAKYGMYWVESSFVEYLVQDDLQGVKAPIPYITGVLENWSVEGMRMTDVIEHLRRRSD